MTKSLDLIRPNWPAPSQVQAVSTTRLGGMSLSPYASFNLGSRVQDDPKQVAANRQQLSHALELPTEPAWLSQVHGCTVVAAEQVSTPLEADASYSRKPGSVCVVMTADCLPVLFCNQKGDCVAAVHAGWRGLAAGVIAAAVKRMDCDSEQILAWLGPAIGPDAFEVGAEVRTIFMDLGPVTEDCFRPSPTGRWLADIYALARCQLGTLGITAVYGGGWCTYTDRKRFFSYRRDGVTGRMASLIWLSH